LKLVFNVNEIERISATIFKKLRVAILLTFSGCKYVSLGPVHEKFAFINYICTNILYIYHQILKWEMLYNKKSYLILNNALLS